SRLRSAGGFRRAASGTKHRRHGQPQHSRSPPASSRSVCGTPFDLTGYMNSKNNDARVLIVESDDAMRVLLFTILRHQPLAVDTAINGESALEKLMSCDYALLLIDMDLPDDEARQFLRRFRRERPEATTFIIAVRDPRSEEVIDPEL